MVWSAGICTCHYSGYAARCWISGDALMKPWLAPAIILSLLSAAAGGAKFWADNTYVRIASYEQGVEQQRVWSLQDKIDQLKDRADYEHRKLTDHEKRLIEKWESQIRAIKQ